MKNKKIPDNQITVYQTSEGGINIEVLYADENIWLPQKRLAELFGCSSDNISLHLKNIYKEKEIEESSTTEVFSVVQLEGKRADSAKPNMGLTSWRKGPGGKIMPGDVSIAKNYLNKPELDQLNRIVTMYLDFAELQAVRNIPMYMKDWIKKLNAFLKFSEYEILTNVGSISHEVALALSHKEYEIFKKDQDRNYISDFDKEIRRITGIKDGK